MKLYKNQIITSTLFLFTFLLVTTFFLGCEKDLPTKQIASDRVFRGKVVDAGVPTLGIPFAEVQVTLRIGEPMTKTVLTNENGDFEITLPAYPDAKTYFIEVRKDGYYPADTFANCDCNVLIIPTLKLKLAPPDCGIQVQGLVDITQVVAVGDSLDFTVPVTNLKRYPMTIKAVTISAPYIKLVTSLDITLPPNTSRNVNFRFLPTKEFNSQDTIKWKIACDENTYQTIVILRSQYRRCLIYPLNPIGRDTIYLKVGKVDTGYVVVQNLSSVLSLFYNETLLPNTNYFTVIPTVVPPNKKEILPKTVGNSDTIRVIVKSNAFSNRAVDSMIVSTFGFCDKKIWIIADSSTVNLRLAFLPKWAPSTVTNPKYQYMGLRFVDQIAKPENDIATSNKYSLNNLCGTDPNHTIGQIWGEDSADVRFDGFDNLGNVVIQAPGGIQYLGRGILDATTKNKIDKNPNAWSNKGCSSTFVKGDIIAIRWYRNPNKFAIIQISNLIEEFPPPAYQSIQVKYYPDIDLIQ